MGDAGSALRVASLGMYDMPFVAEANDVLWTAIAGHLVAAEVTGVPERLDRSRPLDAIWRDENLLLAQTCGYPLVTTLACVVTPVAIPIYRWPGCDGPLHRSVLVVAAAASYAALSELRGRRVAINGWDSNTGMNLLRHRVAPLADGRPFFAAVIETGAHLASAAAVASGAADVAAIDAVTYALAQRHAPHLTAGLRVIGETAPSPSLPFVTRAGAAPRDVALLCDALSTAIASPAFAAGRAALGLVGIVPADPHDYNIVSRYEQEAIAAGYPTLR